MSNVINVPSWGPDTRKPTRRELTARHIDTSEMFLMPYTEDDGQTLRRLRIEIHGELAALPSLKNSKIPGKNFINPAVMAKVLAMDELYALEVQKIQKTLAQPVKFSFGLEPVHVLLVLGRKCRVDRFNAMETISDWLEPRTKPVGKRVRGWGAGLIADDANMLGIPVRCRDVGFEHDVTIIDISRLDTVRAEVLNFVAKLQL